LRSHISLCIRVTESITSLIYDRSLIWHLTVWRSLLIRIFIVTIIFSSILSLRSSNFNFLFLIFYEIGRATFLRVTFRRILKTVFFLFLRVANFLTNCKFFDLIFGNFFARL
jgi:hypothetical protein